MVGRVFETPGLEGRRKPTINLSHDNRCQSRDLSPGPREYEASVLIITAWRFVMEGLY
jgi:hypothetical protein